MDLDRSSEEDNTAFLTMKRHFDHFISGSTGSRKRPASSLDFKESYIETVPGDSMSQSREGVSQLASASKQKPVSMQQIFEKEKEERVRQAELVRARSTIAQLESRVASLNTAIKHAAIEHQQNIDSIKLEHKHELGQLSDLKHQLRQVAGKEVQAQEELQEVRATLNATKTSLEEKVRQLKTDKYKLETESQEREQSMRTKLSELRNDKLRMQTELEICKSDLTETKDQLQNALRRCSDLNTELQEAQDCKHQALTTNHRVKELEMELRRVEEESKVGLAMRSQLSRLHEVEAENRKMRNENAFHREMHENTALLQEQLESLKSQLERAQERAEGYSLLQIEHEEVKGRLAQWEAVGKGVENWPKSPAELSRQMADLQSTNAMLLSRQGQLQTSAHVSTESRQAMETSVHQLKEQLSTAQQEARRHAEVLKRAQRRLLLVTKERDGYKRIIDSYESEVTVNVAASSQGRLKEAEDIRMGYEAEFERLEKDLESVTLQMSQAETRAQMLAEEVRQLRQMPRPDAVSHTTSEADQTLIISLREKIVEVERSLEKALQEKEVLEARMERHNLQGDYDPTTTKVLHLQMNPLSQAQRARAEQVERLTEENRRLKERLRLVEEGGGAAEDVTMKVEEQLQQPSSSKEVEDMRQQLSTAELKNKRLMEAFTKKAQEFREVCYQLLGYRIDISGANQYKLMNMYSESPDDYLLFKQTTNGELQILGTEFSSTLQDNIEHYLSSGHSIPAFLSSITMDLFSRQTLMS